MRLQEVYERTRIHPLKLVVGALLPFQPHPDPADPQSHELIDRIGLQDARGAEYVDGPAFPVGFHQLQEPERPFLVEEEILVQREEGFHLELFLHVAHGGKEFIAGFEEIDELSLPAEQGGGGAEVAAHRATDRGNQDRRRAAGAVSEAYPHHPPAEPRYRQRVLDGPSVVLTQIALKPANPLPAHDMVRIDQFIETFLVADMAADDDRCGRLMPPDQPAHLPDLADIREDGADPDDVVTVLSDLCRETLQGGKVQQGAGGVQVVLDHHQPEGAMKHPEREPPLDSGDLILVEFHGVDFAASVLVIPGVRAKDAREQDAGTASERMDWLISFRHAILLIEAVFGRRVIR